MIARLHAMYQWSRKILIFLIVIFLTVNIFGVVGAVVTTTHASWGTLKSCAWQKCTWGSLMQSQRKSFSPAPICAQLTLRKIPYFWVPLLGYLALRGRSSHYVSQFGSLSNTSVNYNHTRQEGLSGLWGTVSGWWWKLTCFTLRGEFMLWTWPLFPLKDWTYQLHCCLLLPPHSWLVSSTLSGMSIFHWPLHAALVHHFYRNIPWAVRLVPGCFRFRRSCSRLCWDPAWSLAFENITLSSWPTLIQQLPWPPSLSKSTCKYRLAVVCNAWWSWQLFGVLKGAGKYTFMYSHFRDGEHQSLYRYPYFIRCLRTKILNYLSKGCY